MVTFLPSVTKEPKEGKDLWLRVESVQSTKAGKAWQQGEYGKWDSHMLHPQSGNRAK